jgi:hypothetical protein
MADNYTSSTNGMAPDKQEGVTYDIAKLNDLYRHSESCDADVMSEMRSNILIVSGQHYKKIQRGLSRSLDKMQVDKSKRLRLVKNHTAKAVSDVKDILASMAPGVLPYPAHEDDRDSQKAAELAKPVWADGELKNDFEDMKESLRNSFVVTGEAAAKIFFDPIKGGVKAYNQKTTDDGKPVHLDPTGKEVVVPDSIHPDNHPAFVQHFGLTPAPDKTQPVFRGQLTIEKIEPYNLLRPKNAKSMRSAKFLIHRKMVDLDDARALINSASTLSQEDKNDRLKWIEGSGDTTYKIFDGTSGSFQDSKGQVMFREFYFRQSPEFPHGHYFITVQNGILFEGDLPFGEFGEDAFPIKWNGYDLYEGSCRGFSPIKRIRPCQIEINRAASSWSETQITVGHDKIVLTKNAKFSRGVDQPGLRVFHTTDGEPTVIPGRDGGQFVPMLEHNVAELYRLINLPENANPVAQANDPRAELFKKQSQKARFTEPANRLARLFRDICNSYLFFAQKYMSEDDLREVVGKTKSVDIAEFKNVDRMCLKVKLMEVTDDLDSMMGKTLEIESIIQYMGKNLDPETQKILISQFPVLNKTSALRHLTMDTNNIDSDILALDRGEYRPANMYDDHALFIKHLTNRMKQRDFDYLADPIKANYAKRKDEHEKFIQDAVQKEQEAAAGWIPSGGALAKADLYINPDPNNPSKVLKATFPTEALEWLKSRLDAQGSTQALLGTIASQGAQGEIAGKVGPGMGVGAHPDQNVGQPPPPAMPQGMPPGAPPQAPAHGMNPTHLQPMPGHGSPGMPPNMNPNQGV